MAKPYLLFLRIFTGGHGLRTLVIIITSPIRPSRKSHRQERRRGGGGMYFLGVVIGDLVFLGVVQAKFFKKIKLVFVRVYIYLPSAHLMHTNTQLILRNIKE